MVCQAQNVILKNQIQQQIQLIPLLSRGLRPSHHFQKPLVKLFLINIIHESKLSNCTNYLIQPNLLFIVYRSKNIDINETTAPNIINRFDFSFSFFSGIFLDKDVFLSLSLLIRF